MRRSLLPLAFILSVDLGCHSAPRDLRAGLEPLTSAAAIVEGRVGAPVPKDTVDADLSVGVVRARWTARRQDDEGDFWSDVALLDASNAERAATTMDERTFAAALRTLLEGRPDAAAVAFELLHASAQDPVIRARSRIGLTMALSYDSDWGAMARLRPNAASTDSLPTSLAVAAGVERWARALSMVPTPVFDIPDQSVVLPMRRSSLGTPVVTIRINGRPHDFWLDTGASMTLLSADVAIAAGAKLASSDTLALGVVGGHI
jgi:hypothetical protein